MKVLHLSTSDLSGGAARATYRLHRKLLDLGINSQILVQDKLSDDYTIIGSETKFKKGWGKIKPTLDSLPLNLYPNRDQVPYSLQWIPSKINSQIELIAPDIINLHWVGGGYFPVEKIAKFAKPFVWTLHDMWGFTGGCHYTQECDRYKQSCGHCPVLKSNKDWDLSHWLWQRKAKAWQELDFSIISPSQWLANCAKASSLFQNLQIEVIPNGLDNVKYKPTDKNLARQLIGLPSDKKIILFGAVSATSDSRKGFHLLSSAFKQLRKHQIQDSVELVIFGSSQPRNPPDFGMKTHYLGKLNDDISIALLYSAADVFIAPSMQDNLPNTVMEAMSCGTPSVAFDVGGMPDLIDHQQNGYLATAYDPENFAMGIAWVLKSQNHQQNLGVNARSKVNKEFTIDKQTHKYLQLYEKTLIKEKTKC